MAGNAPLRGDAAFRAGWADMLRHMREAGARDASFWAALGQDVAASEPAREALAAAWSETPGDWPAALTRYRWWMQDHPDLFPTVNDLAVDLAIAAVVERRAKQSAVGLANSPAGVALKCRRTPLHHWRCSCSREVP